jgi:phosphate-selective porin OprO/OprP
MLALIVRGTLLTFGAAYAAESPAQPQTAPLPAGESLEYLLPDLPAARLVHDGERYWVRPIIAILADYTFFEQDDASLAQVGEQEDTPDVRAARFGMVLRSKGERGWEAFVAVDYQEKRTREDNIFQLYDLRFRVSFGPVKLDIGKQKQPFAHEMLGLSLLNPQQERILSPFFVTRSIGVQVSGQLAGDRMTWAAGWFNDWLETGANFSNNANDYVGRITGLVKASADNMDYMHLGLGLRRVGSDAGMIRLSGRPESNVADKYLDTGDFPADYAGELSLEAVWDRGPFTLIAEHVESRAAAPDSGNPGFSGSYLMLSWRVTGESRPYNRATGTAVGITPTHRHGAIELVVRFSRVDLKDGAIDGGVLEKTHFGVNWWASRQWKVGASYGDGDLDRDGVRGNTRMLLFRSQWSY